MTYETNKLYKLPLAVIHDDPAKPRKYMDPKGIEEMAGTVRRVGIIQPIVCRQDPATTLVYCVAGERRRAAALLAGLTEIPAIFIDGSNSDEVAIVENLDREDLNPVDEAEALQLLMDRHAYEQEQLAAIIGKSQPTVSESLSLNRLPQEIRDICRQDPSVPKRTLIEIARKKQERSMVTAFTRFRERQAKETAKAQADAGAPAQRKRTKAEAIAYSISILDEKIGDLEFPDFSAEDRTKIIGAMTSMKDTLEEAITRAVKNKKKPR